MGMPANEKMRTKDELIARAVKFVRRGQVDGRASRA
jgi:hypothetical protein